MTEPSPLKPNPARAGPSDRFLASPFRIDWLNPALSRNERDDLERAVAAKAASILRSARFASLLHERAETEIEVKVWLETGFDPAHVAVYVEPRLKKHYFLVMDAHGRERLGAVVFDAVPSVTGDEVRAETRLFMEAIERVMTDQDGMELGEVVMALQADYAQRDGRA